MPMMKEKGKPAYWRDEPEQSTENTEKPKRGKKKKESDE